MSLVSGAPSVACDLTGRADAAEWIDRVFVQPHCHACRAAALANGRTPPDCPCAGCQLLRAEEGW